MALDTPKMHASILIVYTNPLQKYQIDGCFFRNFPVNKLKLWCFQGLKLTILNDLPEMVGVYELSLFIFGFRVNHPSRFHPIS